MKKSLRKLCEEAAKRTDQCIPYLSTAVYERLFMNQALILKALSRLLENNEEI